MAWSFAGDNDVVELTDHAALRLPDGNWTIAGWVKLDAGATNQNVLSWGAMWATPNLQWYFQADNTLKVASKDNDGTEVLFAGVGTPGTSTVWQHLILQRSGNTVTQYVNNVADGAETDVLYDDVNVAANWRFGSRTGGDRWLGGDLAEWAKWDRALNASERAGLAKGFSPLFYPGWKWYVPMIRAYQESIVPLTVTNDGSVVAPHPPIIYPFGTRPVLHRVVITQGIHVYDEVLGPRLSRRVITWHADNFGHAGVWLDGREAPRLCGLIDRLVTVPSVARPPTANYDITLTTPHGTDLLDGDGANRSDTVVEVAWIEDAVGATGQAEVPGNDELHFEVANAGAGGAGVAVLYVLQP